MEGGCACGGVRYRLTAPPIFVIHVLIEAARVAPDVHIDTRSKLPWITLPATVPAFEPYYDASQLWPAASLARRNALFGKYVALQVSRGRALLPPFRPHTLQQQPQSERQLGDESWHENQRENQIREPR